jgi:hypothetical protein
MKTLVATTALITEIRRIMLAQKKRGTSGASIESFLGGLWRMMRGSVNVSNGSYGKNWE